MWSGIEACASVICANLPCYTPFLGKARGDKPSVRPKLSFNFSSGHSNPWSRPSGEVSKHKATSSTEIIITGRNAVETSIEGAALTSLSNRDIQMGDVVVHTTVDTDFHSVRHSHV